MPYGTISTLNKTSCNVRYLKPDGEGGLVSEEISSEKDVPVKFIQRVGFNNPLNGPLLAIMGKSKVVKPYFVTKKVIMGYRFYYKKVYFTRYRRKKITKIIFKDAFRIRSDGSKKRYTVRRVYFYYIYTPVLAFKKIKVRVPIKIRVRVPVFRKPPAVVQVPLEKPYLLPNSLTFVESEVRSTRNHYEFHGYLPINGGSIVTDLVIDGLGLHNMPISAFPPFRVFFLSPAADSSPIPPYDDIYLSSTALHGLYKKVASDLPSTLTSLAELPETLSAVKDILKDGVKLAIALKKFDAKFVYSYLNKKAIAKKDDLSLLSSKVWLTWYLAVSPTISDISEHLSLLSREERVWRKFSKTATIGSDQGFGDDTEFTHYRNEYTVKYGVLVEGRCTLDEYKNRFADADQLSSALYAIVPLSFVADWAVDVSSYLESANILQGLEYDAWVTTVRNEQEITKHGKNLIQQEYYPLERPYRSDLRKFRLDRTPLDVLPSMPLIPWKKKLVDSTVLSRTLTALSLIRAFSSK